MPHPSGSDTSPASPLRLQAAGDSLHRSILLIDIEGYSRPPRTNRTRGRLRRTLYVLLDGAIGSVGVGAGQYETMDQGDGVLVLFHPDVPKNRLLNPLLTDLARRLVGHNRVAPEGERIRLRAVVHAGELLVDEHGYYGEDLDHAFGLVDSNSLRARLAGAGSPVVQLVSERIFHGVVKHEPDGIDPATYERVKVAVKRGRVCAWLHVPSGAAGEDAPRAAG